MEKVAVTGSIKFDGVETDRNNPRTAELRRSFDIAADERVFVAGSTQQPEEACALDAWQALRSEFPQLRLVLVPRHKERFEQVARLVESRGLPLVRRSLSQTIDPQSSTPPVCLLDTLGELGACWGLADVAFVGGSLTQRGGQNMIEPAAYGAAVLFGPNTWNFRDVVERLLSEDAAGVVAGAAELTAAVRRLLADPQAARQQGERARKLVRSQQGAAARTVALILRAVPDCRGPSIQRAA